MTLWPDDGRQHGLKLRLSFGEFGEWFAVGNDASASKQARLASVLGELGTTNCHGPCAVASRIDPTHGASVAAAAKAFDVLNEIERGLLWMATKRWCW